MEKISTTGIDVASAAESRNAQELIDVWGPA